MLTLLRDWAIERANTLLPSTGQIPRRPAPTATITVIGTTTRAADLDPTLLRPGRFERSVRFDPPDRSGRRELIDHFLDRRASEPELDDPGMRDTLAAMTSGYTPGMIEHMIEQAQSAARQRGSTRLSWIDLQRSFAPAAAKERMIV